MSVISEDIPWMPEDSVDSDEPVVLPTCHPWTEELRTSMIRCIRDLTGPMSAPSGVIIRVLCEGVNIYSRMASVVREACGVDTLEEAESLSVEIHLVCCNVASEDVATMHPGAGGAVVLITSSLLLHQEVGVLLVEREFESAGITDPDEFSGDALPLIEEGGHELSYCSFWVERAPTPVPRG
jgi:hypothetical protein